MGRLLLLHALHVQGEQFTKRDRERDLAVLASFPASDTDLAAFHIHIRKPNTDLLTHAHASIKQGLIRTISAKLRVCHPT